MASQSTTANIHPAPKEKPVVVGLYGVPGSGKTFLLNQHKNLNRGNHWEYFEGSEMIAQIVPGGLDAFQDMDDEQKSYWRNRAIDTISQKCVDGGNPGIVAGHFMFWPEGQETGQEIHTERDLATFTHIIYLDTPADLVVQRRLEDKERIRPRFSTTHLRKWQQAEKIKLRDLCRNHRILFSVSSSHPATYPSDMPRKMKCLLHDFRQHTEDYNLHRAEREMDEAIAADQSRMYQGHPEIVLVMDAERTLTAEDTGTLFWKMVSKARLESSWEGGDEKDTLQNLLDGPLGYSYLAFRQAALLYEDAAYEEGISFNAICEKVASAVSIHPEFVILLRQISKLSSVGVVIVSCGLRAIWERVLEREGLSNTVRVIGGGRISDGFVVTPEVKAALVSRLQDVHQKYVWVFGASPLDLEMLKKADQAIVVVGEEQTRSKNMDEALTDAIDNHRLRARQVLLPSDVSPRLDTTKLPLIQITGDFIESVLCQRIQNGLQVLHATEKSATRLLMTPMRDARNAGAVLREAHRRVGWYLATEFLVDAIGLDEYEIPHVQGQLTTGHRFRHENQISIVALMRGGEPMALGVSDALPLAMFIHAKTPVDIKLDHLHRRGTVVLVDSVVNSGETVVAFVEHVRKLCPLVRVVVVVGVACDQSVSKDSPIEILSRRSGFSIVALRLSENKFPGRGVADTGNRLFNTTHLQ